MSSSASSDPAFAETFARLEQQYGERLARFGDSPEGTQQADVATQEQRMRILCQAGDLRRAKVLDFGCGTGHLLAFLRRECAFDGEYVGYDISPDMIDIATNKFPDARFERRNVLADGVPEDFDFVLITGTFNNLTGNNWEWMTLALKSLFARTRTTLAFNNLSAYVDFFSEGLYYEDPARVLKFCKEELSPLVTLRHDYGIRPGVVPYEFTTYVHRTDILPRKLLING